MRRPFMRTAGVVAVVAALIGAAAALQSVRERRYPPSPARDRSLYLTSGATARRLAVGYDALAADLYWIRAIQYYGETKQQMDQARTLGRPAARENGTAYPLLYPLLDLTTELDSRFNIAYRFGAIFLAEANPSGAGQPELAIRLLEKGLRARPDKWEYMQDIGFVHYWWDHDYPRAAQWFDRASRVPGAPWWLRSLAATTLAAGGDRRSSRTMWESIQASAEIDWLRTEADRRLMQLDALDFMPSVQQRVDRYTGTTGTPPHDWNALIRAGLLPGVPIDPAQTPYELDAEGHVRLSRQSPLFPLPDEPQRAATPGS